MNKTINTECISHVSNRQIRKVHFNCDFMRIFFPRHIDSNPGPYQLMSLYLGFAFLTEIYISLLDHFAPIGSKYSGWTSELSAEQLFGFKCQAKGFRFLVRI